MALERKRTEFGSVSLGGREGLGFSDKEEGLASGGEGLRKSL